MRRLRHILAPLILLPAAAIILQCAKIEPPPGGPEDKMGPSILKTSPSAGAVKITSSNTVSILFSEGVDHRSAEAACFITPLTDKKPRFKWHGHEMYIIMPDSFAEKTTYIVNVGSSVIDYRNNKMAQSFQFAFTTGDSISDGKTAGMIYQGINPAAGITVGFYDTASNYSYKTFDSVIPEFLTVSGSDGKYAQDFLPRGKFVSLAFKDINNNRRFDYPDEDYGIPNYFVDISPIGISPSIDFYMRRTDTITATILSTSLTSDRLIRVRFSGKLKAKNLAENLKKISMSAVDSSGIILHPSSLFENPDDTLSSYSFYFPNLSEGSWRFALSKECFGSLDTSNIEGSVMQIKFGKDEIQPEIISVSLSGQTNFPDDSIIEINFSEPIDKGFGADSMAIVKLTDSSIVPAVWQWKDDFRLDLSIPARWGESYRLEINQAWLRDMAGNLGGDSIKTYSFKTYSRDSLGAISGTVSRPHNSDSTYQIYLIFSSVPDHKVFQEKLTDSTFQLSLPGGKYLLSGFVDRNGNQKQDLGSLTPFELAEPSAHYPDTVRVRSRFESAGLDFIFK
ncbi:exported hypothetical protein [Candidatus Zixiibacteriota bacterium]|nr:exported hypothetical protein [candidate division Zixibacteria bacterium]